MHIDSRLTVNMSASDAPSVVEVAGDKQHGLRVNGKHWKQPKAAFRLNKGMTSFEKRMEERKNHQAAKSKIKEMKDEKEALRAVRQDLVQLAHHKPLLNHSRIAFKQSSQREKQKLRRNDLSSWQQKCIKRGSTVSREEKNATSYSTPEQIFSTHPVKSTPNRASSDQL